MNGQLTGWYGVGGMCAAQQKSKGSLARPSRTGAVCWVQLESTPARRAVMQATTTLCLCHQHPLPGTPTKLLHIAGVAPQELLRGLLPSEADAALDLPHRLAPRQQV